MLQRNEPDDYILASGVGHTVADFAERAFAGVGLRAEGHLSVDAVLVRPAEGTPRVGDSTRARRLLGWRPTVSIERLIERMVEADLRALQP